MRAGDTPPRSSTPTAPSASFLEIGSLNRAATTAKQSARAALALALRSGARPAMSVGQRGEEMAHLLPLGQEVAPIALRGRDLDGHALHDLQSVSFDAHDLLRIVGEDAEPPRPQVHEDLRPDTVVTQVRLEPQSLIGLHGVLAAVLDLVGAQLVEEPNAPPLLPHVHEHAATFALDDGEGLVELRAAIAAPGAEDVAGETLGMHAHEHGLLRPHIAHDEGHG